MSEILTGFLEAALIEHIAGEDTRFEKMAMAASTVAEDLKAEPRKLIPAILAGINPDITAEDPAIVQAKLALVAEWKTMETIYTSPPINLYRAILLDACRQAAEEGNNAAILWLIAVDTFSLMRLGKEEAIIRSLLETFEKKAETLTVQSNDLPKHPREISIKLPEIGDFSIPSLPKTNRKSLRLKFGDAAGNSHVLSDGNNGNGGDPNPNWASNGNHLWAGHFAERMTNAISDELDSIKSEFITVGEEIITICEKSETNLITKLEKALNDQRLFIQRVAKNSIDEQKAEQTRLNVLWWSEALYSSPLRKSYREIEPYLAAAIMPTDLLKQIALPAPASVGYMLSETVCKLSDANFNKEELFKELLVKLRSLKNTLPTEIFEGLIQPASEGFLTLRDLVILALIEPTSDLETLSKRAGITSNFKISLPVLSRAIFRQEQAFLLAEEA
ncbi:GTPase-associated system all-helical protein GASH [Shewanella vaxholmensis]|uniref:GTPase-associated system all-helical protein GASH n=1 Tax=Shewanella vaxholmensis TaxID=3063535 RepID=UPI0031863859